MAAIEQEVSLLPAEITVAVAYKAQRVVCYARFSNISTQAVLGTLICTNYRLIFQTDAQSQPPDTPDLPTKVSLPLGCVDQILMIHSGKKKALDGRSTLPRKIVEFEMQCKDLQRLVFNLRQCSKNEVSSMLNALARHTNPSSVHNLFAFDYSRVLKAREDPGHAPDSASPNFLNPRDWQKELNRLGVTSDQWRVTESNKQFLICDNLSPYFVCPTNISDSMIEFAASLHQRNRLPVWVWSHPHTGVSLTRGAVPEIDDQSEAPDPNYLYAIAMARHIDNQVESKKIQQYNLTRSCGTVKDISSAFAKMQELCTPMSVSEIQSLDKRWLLGLESSGWLALVRSCLLQAKETAHSLCVKRRSVLLLEERGRDVSCVVSSLVQIMVDPYYRSISGFEALLQKDWVAMGHPFTTRHGLIYDTVGYGTEEELLQAPVFLLFLDCVWQLSRQFPSALEFTESYLLRLFALTHSCLYGNFLFNSPKNRVQASLHSKRSSFFGVRDEAIEQANDYEGPLTSAWGRWRQDLRKEENEECLNPFYYVFGSSDALCEYNTSVTIDSLTSNHVTASQVRTSVDVAEDTIGIYRGPSPTAQLKSKDNVRDFYHLGILLPETSMASIRVWAGFFFRYIPDMRESCRQNVFVQMLESRLVRDVRKLKDELNDLELQRGSFASDLTSFIGEAVQAREQEMERERTLSITTPLPARSNLKALILELEREEEERAAEGDDEEEWENSGEVRSKVCNGDAAERKVHSVPVRMSSLAQFTDTLYSMEEGVGDSKKVVRTPPARGEYKPLIERSHSVSDSNEGRSPVVKTRVRVKKTESPTASHGGLRWHAPASSLPHERHSLRLADRILNRKDSGVLEEGYHDELTEL